MDITLLYLPDAVIIVDDMMGKVSKLRYADHDVHDAEKFLELAKESYLINTREIGPLDKPIMDLAKWIIGLYNYGIMNLLDISHFGCSKNVGLYIKQLVAHVHRGILWMDRPVQIEMQYCITKEEVD
jgi:hypothetical protein